jgi:hypothetical protein
MQITATSSDKSLTPPVLTLSEPAVAAGTFSRDAVTGVYSLKTPLPATATATPPQRVRVLSSYGGSNSASVVTLNNPTNAPGTPPSAQDDRFVIPTLLETSMPIDVLSNDLFAAEPTIFILTQPTSLGIVSAPASGGPITLSRPIPSITGRDSFTYVLRVGKAMSNVATVTIITAVQGRL